VEVSTNQRKQSAEDGSLYSFVLDAYVGFLFSATLESLYEEKFFSSPYMHLSRTLPDPLIDEQNFYLATSNFGKTCLVLYFILCGFYEFFIF
jgi:hypothetical protein